MAKSSDQTPLVIWAVSDGRAGMESQVVGLANAIAAKRKAEVVVKRVAWKGRIGRLPWWLNPFPLKALRPDTGIAPPWPDIWLAAGRATLPLSIRLKAWTKNATFVVQTQDPRMPTSLFDLVIPPKHDRLQGDNVFAITGSPNGVNAKRLKAELARFKKQIDALPHPRVAVVIGGKSKAHNMSVERAATLAHEIELPVAQEGGSVMVSFSPVVCRTCSTKRTACSASTVILP